MSEFDLNNLIRVLSQLTNRTDSEFRAMLATFQDELDQAQPDAKTFQELYEVLSEIKGLHAWYVQGNLAEVPASTRVEQLLDNWNRRN